jgi:hypothetical protein
LQESPSRQNLCEDFGGRVLEVSFARPEGERQAHGLKGGTTLPSKEPGMAKRAPFLS